MPRIPWVLSVALLGLVVPSVPAQLPPPLGQNDAGSGADAPNAAAQALPLAPGVYVGMLAGAVSHHFGPSDVPVDLHDWYRVWIDEGRRIKLGLEGLHAPVPVFDPVHHTMFELLTPGGVVANWLSIATPHVRQTTSLIAAESGWWQIHFFTFRMGGEYRFDVELESPAAPGFAHAGNGYQVAGITIEPGGGRFTIDLMFAHVYRDGAAGAYSFYEFMSTGEGRWGQGEFRGSSGLTATVIVGTTQTTVAAAEGSDIQYWRTTTHLEESAPGTYYFLLFAKMAEAYTSYDFATYGNVTVIGATRGDESSIIAKQQRDFTGTFGFSATLGQVAFGLETQFEVQHRLWGDYSCGPPSVQCTVQRPGGQPEPVVGGASYQNEVPGTWRFTRTNEVQPTRNDFILFFGVDYELPEPACKEPKGKHNGEGHGQGHGHGHTKCR